MGKVVPLFGFAAAQLTLQQNMTALMIACNLGHAGVVEILLRVPNLDVNIQEVRH